MQFSGKEILWLSVWAGHLKLMFQQMNISFKPETGKKFSKFFYHLRTKEHKHAKFFIMYFNLYEILTVIESLIKDEKLYNNVEISLRNVEASVSKQKPEDLRSVSNESLDKAIRSTCMEPETVLETILKTFRQFGFKPEYV